MRFKKEKNIYMKIIITIITTLSSNNNLHEIKILDFIKRSHFIFILKYRKIKNEH